MVHDATPNPYAVAIDDLERSAHVAVEAQSTEQPASPPDATDADQVEARRQARLAGGA